MSCPGLHTTVKSLKHYLSISVTLKFLASKCFCSHSNVSKACHWQMSLHLFFPKASLVCTITTLTVLYWRVGSSFCNQGDVCVASTDRKTTNDEQLWPTKPAGAAPAWMKIGHQYLQVWKWKKKNWVKTNLVKCMTFIYIALTFRGYL